MIDLYRGKTYEEMSDEDRTQVNLAFATVNVIYPTVSVSSPKFIATPTKPEMVDAAELVEAAVNYWWRHYRFLPEWRAAVKDCNIVGHGWVKTGYRYVEEEVERDQSDIDDEVYDLLAQQDEAVFDPESGITEADLPDEADVMAQVATSEKVPVEDQPFVERVSPFDMIVDPDATCERELKWIAQRIIMDWASFQEDDRFSPAAKKSAQRRDNRRDEDDRPRFTQETDEDGYVAVYEYYDLRKGTMCMFTSSGDGFLVKPAPVPLPYKNPFTIIPNYEVPEYFYPIGDLEGIEVLQAELNQTRTQMFNDRKRYIPKYVMRKGAFNEEGVNQLRSDTHNAIAEVVDQSVDLRDAIIPLPQSDVRPELYQQSDLIQGDINNVSGVSDYQRGALPEIRRTATEASIIQDTANARAADKLSSIEWRLAEVGYRILQLAQTHMDGDLVARIVGEDGSMNWVQFTPEDIQGEFDFEVEMGSTKPSNESTKAQRAMQMMDAVGPWIGSGYLQEQEVIKHVLYSFGVRDPERFLGPGPQAMMPPGEEMIDPETGMPMDPAMMGEVPPGAEQGGDPYAPEMSQFDPQMTDLMSMLTEVQ
jgi:hypothetical protein